MLWGRIRFRSMEIIATIVSFLSGYCIKRNGYEFVMSVNTVGMHELSTMSNEL